jgi:DNA-binding LacI/PurR family transcriptional regulator
VTGIRQLANHLNISIGTVSRALNNRADVNPETRRRVLEAALELGYVANQSGRSLRRGATNTIGFVIETGGPASEAGDNFFFLLTDSMNAVLSQRGYDLVILPCHSADDPVEFLARTVARGTVDALVITATRRQDQRIALLSKSKMPFLTLGRSDTPGDYPWFDLDFEGIAQSSVTKLVALGHRRIAVVLPQGDESLGHYYLKGYLAGLNQAGIAPEDALILRFPTSEEGGFAAGSQIATMAEPPTAAVLCSDATPVGLYSGLHSHGLTPGKDLSVVLFRESPQTRFLDPKPTCFYLDVQALGEALSSSVLTMLSDPKTPLDAKIWPLEFRQGTTLCPPRTHQP